MTLTSIAFEMAAIGRGEQPSPERLLHQMTALTARLLPGCCGASITVWDGGRKVRSAVSHVDLAALRDLPRSSSEDPDWQASAQDHAVILPDTLRPDEWAGFCLAAAAFGIRSVAIYPLEASPLHATFGFYATQPHALDNRDLALVARQAGTVLHDAGRYDELESSVRELRAGLESRSIIDQAAGIIMAELSCTPDAALAELRKRSQQGNVKLAEVAKQLVSDRSRV